MHLLGKSLIAIFVVFNGFSVAAQAPTITSFSPSSGSVGTLVTITGTNLSNPTTFNIGGVAAIVVSNIGNQLVGLVMPGAATGIVSVSTAGGTATGTGNFVVVATTYPGRQQGAKLAITTAPELSTQGYSISLSSDGNTAIVGGTRDNNLAGAAWVYIRTGSVWTQQGAKLVGSGAVGAAQQGSSVSVSFDGNTVIVGGAADNNRTGAAWLFARVGGVWTQQGAKLVGSGAIGEAQQGQSVSLSPDGNTAIVGGSGDNGFAGAAWVFTRTGSVWTQQGAKLAGNREESTQLGRSVSLSYDGNTALVGGNGDNFNTGAAWVFTRTGSAWTQQGAKLVGTGATGVANQGMSVSLSSDGTTAIIGGPNDNGDAGAVWLFTRTGSVWTQQGSKLVGSGAVGAARQGWSVSLSSNGNTATVGGYSDNANTGAAWVFTRSGGVWTQQGAKLVGSGAVGASFQGQSVALSSDGSTAIVGGFRDNVNAGASWVYTRIGSVWTQQGSKLTSTVAVVAAQQGHSVSISSDGNTAIVGGISDNSNIGAAWVYTRTQGAWTQQGIKLVGSGAVGPSQQGYSVSLSSDGNTAIVGALGDNSFAGAAWVFSRAAGIWTQQGQKLVGTGALGAARQGVSVCLSSDGNTAIVGGLANNNSTGAAWIYTRTGGVWTQQGARLVGTGLIGQAQLGISVSLSSDGNTAIVGGNNDNSGQGAAWVFTRTSGVWTQQGSKLIGTGAMGAAFQGRSVALSSDGNTAIVGGDRDNLGRGATWVFTRTGSIWTQQGAKLVGSGATGAAGQGWSVSLSSDGNTAILGGYTDDSNAGATWVFTRTAAVWTQQDTKLVGTGAVGPAQQGRSVSLSFDGNTAIVGGVGDNSNVGAAWIFVVSEPTIISFTPISAFSGATVTISGAKFTGATAVSFGGIAATSFTVVNDATITAIVGAGASGNVSVTTPGGTANLAGFAYIPAPTITLFTPTIVGTGATVTINGTNFTGATAVSFGGTAATSFTVVNSTTITSVVAAGASGSVSVTTPGGTATLAGFTYCAALTPTISIAASPSSAICAGTSLIFLASAENTGGGTVTYDFLVNGISVQNSSSGSYTASLAAGDLVSCVLTITGGTCLTTNTAASGTIAINSLPVAAIINNSGTTVINCNNSINVTATGGVNYLWDNSLGNTAGATINSAGVFTVTVTDATGCTNTASITTTSSNINTWNGSDGNFSDGSKWSCGTPTPGGTLAINAGNVILDMNFDVQGSLTLSNTATLSVNPGITLAVGSTGTLALGDKPVTFKSNATGTASLGQVTGTLTGATNVTVERYIPNNGFRSWRLLSVPTVGTQTIKQSWQEGNAALQNNTPGYGTQIAAAGSVPAVQANGFDNASTQTSIQRYNGTSWVNLTSTLNPISNEKAYFLFVRGDRTQGVIGATTQTTATTLRTKGSIYTGSQASGTIGANAFQVLGNPFVSAIDFTGLNRTGGVKNTFYIWDSKKQSGSSLGAYQTFSSTNGFACLLGGGSYVLGQPNTFIQSGQAFFVETGAAGGTVTIPESAKVASIGTSGLRPTTPASTLVKIDTRLYTSNGNLADANVVVFDDAYAADVDGDDALKLGNPGENFAVVRNNQALAVEGRPTIAAGDVVDFKIWNLQQQQYRFEFAASNMAGLTAVLEDKFLNSRTRIDLATISSVNFTVTADAASKAVDRFRLVFAPAAPLPVSFLGVSANRTAAGVQANWKVAAERNINRYEVERSENSRNFSKAGTVTATGNNNDQVYGFNDATAPAGTLFYRVKSIGTAGEVKYSSIVKVAAGAVNAGYSIAPNPVEGGVVNLQFTNQPAGLYNVRVLNIVGQSLLTQQAVHTGGNSTQVLNLPHHIPGGSYQLEVVAPDQSRRMIQLLINE